MIQAEIGGAARVDPGNCVQRPGFIIRDFAAASSEGESVRISSFRGRSNLAVAFPGHSNDMRAFIENLARHISELSDQNTTLVVVLARGREEESSRTQYPPPIIVLYDNTQSAYRLSGASDAKGEPTPLFYLTDRFGEIVSAHVASDLATLPTVGDILGTLEFVNHQCPECEPPEWPR